MTEAKSNGFSTFNLPAQSRQPNSMPLGLLFPQPEADLAVLDNRRIDLNKEPPKPTSVFSLVGQQICTPGNLTVIAAQAKAGKSAVVGAMLAATLVASVKDGTPGQQDLLGFSAISSGEKAVIVFDTEQAPHDAWSLISRGVRRAGTGTLPENFRCYSLVDVRTEMRRQFLEAELQRAAIKCAGIHCVIIDGIADLCVDPNDTTEAFGLVEELVQLAVKHACPIIVVLHENPSGSENGKTRGHLGSHLTRKAESNLRVIKEANDICTIYSNQCRRASIPKSSGPRFAYNVEEGMHMSVSPTDKAGQQEGKLNAAASAVAAVFAGGSAELLSWNELRKRIMQVVQVSDSTAQRRITEWIRLGLIANPQAGQYRRA